MFADRPPFCEVINTGVLFSNIIIILLSADYGNEKILLKVWLWTDSAGYDIINLTEQKSN